MEKVTQKPNIRWGIIGLGNIAHKFVQDLLTVEHAVLYAVASRNLGKANHFSAKYGSIKAYESYDALANDAQVDAVYIATPHSLHKEHAIMCLNKGIAVLCEKPFAMNAAEVKSMISCAIENKVLLMEALWTYFLPHYQYVLGLLKNRTYGEIIKLEADFGFKPDINPDSRVFKKSLGGGSLLDIGIYPIFAALSTLGTPKNIEAQATFYDNGVDSSCSMTFHYQNNVLAELQSSFLRDTPTIATFYCEKATIKINSRFHQPTHVTITTNGNQETIAFDTDSHGYNYEILHFNQLLIENKTESDIMSFDMSLNLMKILDEVRHVIGLEY